MAVKIFDIKRHGGIFGLIDEVNFRMRFKEIEKFGSVVGKILVIIWVIY